MNVRKSSIPGLECIKTVTQSPWFLPAATTVGSLSEKTLRSLNLSCNGDGAERQCRAGSPDDKRNVSNGHHRDEAGSEEAEPEQLIAKKPSYLGLACSISGYSGITRYDSKLREGFRSRDSSPGTRLITRDTSPASFRSLSNRCTFPCRIISLEYVTIQHCKILVRIVCHCEG